MEDKEFQNLEGEGQKIAELEQEVKNKQKEIETLESEID